MVCFEKRSTFTNGGGTKIAGGVSATELDCQADGMAVFILTTIMSQKITLSEQVRRTKRAGDAATVAALEAGIDTRVFRLYSLTPEETALIQAPAK